MTETRKKQQNVLTSTILTLDFLTHVHYNSNLYSLLFNLFISHPLPIKQPFEVDTHNISTPKPRVQDLIVTKYDCPQSILHICSFISSIRLANVRSNQQTFKSSPLKYNYSHKFEHFKYAPTPYMLNLATVKTFITKCPFKEHSALITIIGMLTIWKDLSFPQKLKLVENLHVLVSLVNTTTTQK